MANKYIVVDGGLYSDGVVKEIKIANATGSDIRIQASGTGSCKVVGKLTANGEAKVLDLVRMSDFAITDTITDNEIYATDATGMYSISLVNASGFTNVYAKILA